MPATAALVDLDDFRDESAFADLHDLYAQVDRGAADHVRYLAGALYGIAQRRGLLIVASEAACVAAYASSTAGDAAACAVWAELSLRAQRADDFAWAPLAVALAGAGHVARGDLEAARNAVRRTIRLLDRGEFDRTARRALAVANAVSINVAVAEAVRGQRPACAPRS